MTSSHPSRHLAGASRKISNVPACELPALFASWLGLPSSEPSGLYATVRTFWLFLYQILSADPSCQKTVDEALAWIKSLTDLTPSESTSAYCQARKRLDLKWTVALAKQLVSYLEERYPPTALWLGRRVVIVDGSSSSMPDTKANQAEWPQPGRQKPGLGFPVVRYVVLFSLATGALLECALGSLHVSERELFRRLWRHLKRGDVILSDKGFGSFAEFYFLMYRGVDFVARLNPTRSTGVHHLRDLGKGDRLVEWARIRQAPEWVSRELWKSLPKTLCVREITYKVEIRGFRTETVKVVTTLLDPKAYPAEAFRELYLRRWKAELWLRDLKTTMGMDHLTTKSPEMVRKELAMHWIGYNLMRGLIQAARERYDFEAERISFKGCLNLVRTWAPATARSETVEKQEHMLEALLYYLSRQKVRGRPGRTEPRAVKQRPKNFQKLMKPRHEFQEIRHRNKYTKDKAKGTA